MQITPQQRTAIESLLYEQLDKPTAEKVCNKIHRILHTQQVPEFLLKQKDEVRDITTIDGFNPFSKKPYNGDTRCLAQNHN